MPSQRLIRFSFLVGMVNIWMPWVLWGAMGCLVVPKTRELTIVAMCFFIKRKQKLVLDVPKLFKTNARLRAVFNVYLRANIRMKLTNPNSIRRIEMD